MEDVIPGKAIIVSIATALIGIATIVAGIAFMVALSIGLSIPAEASYMYGDEEPTSQLIVDKQLTTTDINGWQDNLPTSQLVLKDNDLITFRITVKNSGDKDLNKVKVTDTLPQYLTIVFNPGKYDQENNLITWEIDQLKAGKEKTFKIRAHIDTENKAVVDGTLCLINKVDVKAESGEHDEDTTSFCIVAPEKLPEAGNGVSEILMGTGFAAMIGLAGVILRKFGRGQI